MRQLGIIVLIMIIAATGCQKSNNTTPDTSKVIIGISNPQPGQVFHTGDTIKINATVNYGSKMHGYELKITDSATQQVYFDMDDHVHDTAFVVNTYWVNTITGYKGLELELQVAIDHDGNNAGKEVKFRTN